MANEISKDLTVHEAAQAALMELVLVDGDLSRLQPKERVSYYLRTCESLGINHLTRPFEYIKLNGKLTLYTTKNCTDQLRYKHRVSVDIVSREKIGDAYVVTARATMTDGRRDESTGAVTIAKLTGDQLANAMMKSETKAKRRVTLSICGLSFPDESEIDSIKDAQRVSREEVEDGRTVTPAIAPPAASAIATQNKKSAEALIDREDFDRFAERVKALGISHEAVSQKIHRMFSKEKTTQLMRYQLDSLLAALEMDAKDALEREQGGDDAHEQAAAVVDKMTGSVTQPNA